MSAEIHVLDKWGKRSEELKQAAAMPSASEGLSETKTRRPSTLPGLAKSTFAELSSGVPAFQHKRRRSLDATTTFFARWALLIVIFHLFFGTLVLAYVEDWAHRDALYFCVTVLTTVGYGDVVPKTSESKIFCCVYIMCGISIVSACLGIILGRIYAELNTTKMFASLVSSQRGRLLSATASMALVVTMGACSVHLSEGWSVIDSVYWAVVTCSSVGFGDLAISGASRTGNTVYLLFAVGTFVASAGSIAHVFADVEVKRAIDVFLADGVNEDLIIEMDADKGGSVSQLEFLSYMLVQTGKVSKGEINGINELFASLDRDGSGMLDKDDICAAARPTIPDTGSPSKKKASEAHRMQNWMHIGLGHTLAVWQFLRSSVPAIKTQDLSYLRVVDAAVAAVTLALSDLMLYSLDTTGIFPIPIFAAPMLASSIIFFGGPRPPPPASFVIATMGSFFVGCVLHQMGMQGSVAVQCCAAGFLLFVFKLSSSFFPPCVGLAAFLAQSSQGQYSIKRPLAYLVAPWSVGHLLLYGVALSLSVFRQSIRVEITKQGWKQQLGGKMSGPAHEEHLRKVFDRFDTSGDGQLDAKELQLALRSITGNDLDIDDCERMVRGMDTDGNGSIDFHEFLLALDEHL